ncbi:MFS transporter, partial [Actinomyces oris]
SMSESGAGAAASVFSLLGIVGPLLVPVMFEALRWPASRVLGVICACWLMLPVCLTVAPGYWLVPCMLSGIAQGAFFAALFTLVIRRSESVDENRRTTAVIQTTGYCLAAVGPVVMGWVHEHSGGWVAPFAMVTGVVVLMTVCAQIVARAGDSDRPGPSIPAGVLEGDEERAEQGGTE